MSDDRAWPTAIAYGQNGDELHSFQQFISPICELDDEQHGRHTGVLQVNSKSWWVLAVTNMLNKVT